MFVVKRDGRREKVKFDKITARIKKLCYGLDPDYVDPVRCCARSSRPLSFAQLTLCAGRW